MKYFLILLTLTFLVPCPLGAQEQTADPSGGPDFYKNDDHNFLPLGEVTRGQILTLKVYNYNYVEYVPKSDPVQSIHNLLQPVEIKVFFGDWCIDSKKHVPALIKTLEFADNPNIKVTYVNVSRDKKEPAELLTGWNVVNLPTLIALYGGKEVGRIVETPKSGVDQDLTGILASIPSAAQ